MCSSDLSYSGSRNLVVQAGSLNLAAQDVCQIPLTQAGLWNNNGVVKLRAVDGTDKVIGDTAGLPVFSALVKTAGALANSPVYANGTAGVGATLTSTGNHAIGTVGGVAITVVGTIIQVDNQASTFQNGLYVATTIGGSVPYVLTRLPGFDTADSMIQGSLVSVQQGTYAGLLYTMTAAVTTVGTDAVTFALESSGVTLSAVNTALATGQAVFTHTGWPKVNNSADN